MKIICRFILLMAMLVVVACEQQTNLRSSKAYVESGESLLQQGQFRAALIEVQNALQLEPLNEGANILSAKISLELGQIRHAYRSLEAVKGKSFQYYEMLVEAYIQARKYNSALAVMLQNQALFAERPVAQKLLSGRAYAGLGDAETARELFDEVLAIEPGEVNARIGKASLLAARGDLVAAERELVEISLLDPPPINGLMLLTSVYLAQGSLDSAEEMLTTIITVLPSTDIFTMRRAGVLQAMITLLAGQARSGEALVYQRILGDAFPEAQKSNELFGQALSSIQSGDYISAENTLKELYEQSPGHETGGTLLGLLSFLRGEDERAHQYFMESVDLETASTPVLKGVAMNLYRMNQPGKVVDALQSKIALTRDPELLALYGVSAISEGQIDDGVAALTRAIDLKPENVRLRIVLAGYYNSLSPRDYESAFQVLDSGYKLNPMSPQIKISVLNQLLLMGDKDRAKDFAHEQLNAQPDDYDSNVILASYWLRAGSAGDAISYYQRAAEIDPSLKPALFGIAIVNMRNQNWADAKSAYLRITEIDEGDRPALRGLLQVYQGQGQLSGGIEELRRLSKADSHAVEIVITEFLSKNNLLDQAETNLKQLLRQTPGATDTRRLNAEIKYRRSLEAVDKGNYDAARSLIFDALTSFPLNRMLLKTLAHIEIDAGSFLEAKRVLEDIQAQYPDSAMTFEITGDLALAQKQYGDAREAYRSAWNLISNDVIGVKLVSALAAQGEIAKAHDFSIAWKEKLPSSALAIINLVELYPQDNARGIALYEQEDKDFPDNPTILNNLAWLYYLEGDLQKGLEVSARAYGLAKNNPSIMDTYAWLLYHSGDSDKAAKLLQRAILLAPEVVEIQEHLEFVLNPQG